MSAKSKLLSQVTISMCKLVPSIRLGAMFALLLSQVTKSMCKLVPFN